MAKPYAFKCEVTNHSSDEEQNESMEQNQTLAEMKVIDVSDTVQSHSHAVKTDLHEGLKKEESVVSS